MTTFGSDKLAEAALARCHAAGPGALDLAAAARREALEATERRRVRAVLAFLAWSGPRARARRRPTRSRRGCARADGPAE